MGNFSRDSFKETNVLNNLLGLVGTAIINARQYVGVRLQQGVPLLDADWNELEDVRRTELEMVLARVIGNGVPAGSDGFRILEAGINNEFLFETGILFLGGWWVYNPTRVSYANQPHRNRRNLAPPLPALQNIPLARRELVYLDAWEIEVDGQEDGNLVNARIGVETCTRIERVWVVRAEPISGAADPLAPATIPNRQAQHRYYPLAVIDRPPGGLIAAGMITDLRRTSLTLEALTHAPLLIDDPNRGQRLESSRLAGMFRGNLDVLRDLLRRAPEIFVYAGHEAQTWQAMTAYQDVRAAATSFEQQAMNQVLHRRAAGQAMNTFYQAQKGLMETLQGFLSSGIAPAATGNFLSIYRPRLDGAAATDPQSVKFAVDAGDLLGAVLAQERLSEALALQSNTLPEGTVTASLISVVPTSPVVAGTNYQLTIRIQSNLTSALGSEQLRAIVSAGPGWALAFQGTNQPNPREILTPVPNQQSRDVVLVISATAGAANTTLNLTVRPERRQQLVYTNPPAPLAIGQPVLATVIATLNYQGPTTQPGNILPVARNVMSAGVSLPFAVSNLSTVQEVYQVTVTPLSAATGWVAPNQPILQPLAPNGNRTVNINFRTDQPTAVSPLTYRVQLVRVTGGANEPLTNTRFDLTFALT